MDELRKDGTRPPRAARRDGAAGDVRHGGEPRPEAGRRRDRQLGGAGQRGGARGHQAGDVIQSFNGQPVHDFNSLRNRVADAAPGSTATSTIMRDGVGEDAHGQARRGERRSRPPAIAAPANGEDDSAALGISVAPLTPELASRLGVKDTQRARHRGREPGRPGGRRGPSGGRRHRAGEPQAGDLGRRAPGRGEERGRQTRAAAHQPPR